MKENVYKINYKNGNSITTKAYSMWLKDEKLYQCCRAYPFDNGVPSVIDGSKIASVECIEKNNDLEMDQNG